MLIVHLISSTPSVAFLCSGPYIYIFLQSYRRKQADLWPHAVMVQRAGKIIFTRSPFDDSITWILELHGKPVSSWTTAHSHSQCPHAALGNVSMKSSQMFHQCRFSATKLLCFHARSCLLVHTED